MSRTVLGYIDGKPIWSTNVPAAAISGHISGSLVVGGPAGPSVTVYTNAKEARRERERLAAKARREAA